MHGNTEYYPIACDPATLEEVIGLGDHFYERSTGLEAWEIRERYQRNHESVTAIVSFNRENGAKSIVGFYVLLPLTKRGAEAVKAGRVEGSRHLRPDDVCQTFKRFAALYVSAVFGVDNFARVATTNFLTTEILGHEDRRAALGVVFARPTTEEGGAIFENLTGRKTELGPVQTIDLDGDDMRSRYMERGVRVKNIGHKRRGARKRRSAPGK